MSLHSQSKPTDRLRRQENGDQSRSRCPNGLVWSPKLKLCVTRIVKKNFKRKVDRLPSPTTINQDARANLKQALSSRVRKNRP